MNVKIWPRSSNNKGGYACMPMKKNIPSGRKNWKLKKCPECGRECWETPIMRTVVEQQNVIALCTECALKKGISGNVQKE